jgi:hypothetical protein
MKRRFLYRSVILASVIAGGIGGRASAAELRAAPAAASSPSIARFYTSPMVSVGDFPGTLVRLSCDSNDANPKAAPAQRLQGGYGLVLQGDDVIHPLLPGTAEVRRGLSAVGLAGANVSVYGRYYPSNGVIFVSRIFVRTPGAATEEVASEDDQTSGLRLARCVNR